MYFIYNLIIDIQNMFGSILLSMQQLLQNYVDTKKQRYIKNKCLEKHTDDDLCKESCHKKDITFENETFTIFNETIFKDKSEIKNVQQKKNKK